ncbi:TonB-dependent receptor [Sphingomonas sp. UYP23]
MRFLSKYVLLSGCSLLFCAHSASAQTSPSAPQQSPSEATSPQQDATSVPVASSQTAAPETGVGDIVVTATRRAQSIQKVPQQVTALTGKDLGQINAHTLGDFAGFVPGLSTVSSGPTSLIAIRGVTTGSQLSSTVGLYVDEVPIGASTPFGLGGFSFNTNVFDLDRVEVLNGPQGTLFGANSLGGTLRYITAAPDLSGFHAAGETELSTTDHGGTNYGFRAMINAPLASWAAFRLTGLEEYTSGYVDDPSHNRSNQGWFRTHSLRGSLLLKPTNNLDIRLEGFWQRVPSQGTASAFLDPVSGKPLQGKYDQSYPLAQPAVSSLALGSAVVDLQLSFAKLSSITSYQSIYGRSDTDQSLVYQAVLAKFGGGADPWDLYVKSRTNKFNQEVRLASNSGGFFDYIAGVYFDSEQTHEVVNLYDRKNASGLFFGIPPFLDTLPSTYKEIAGYANGTFNFTSRLSLGLGIRYSHQHQTYFQTISGLLATGNAIPSTSPVAITNQSVTTYSINPRFQVTPDVLLYARAASGFRPGGPNFQLSPGLGNTSFNPDKLWNYEVGVKTTFLDRKATLNFDVFDIEWSSIQLTVNVGGVNQLVNGGDARVRGAEGAFSFRPVPALTLGGSATYTDAKLTTAAPALGITSGGARLPFSAKFSGALTASYRADLSNGYSAVLTATNRYQGERFAGFGTAQSKNFDLPRYDIVDLNLALLTPHNIELDLYARNLNNSYGRVGAYTVPLLYNPASPVPVLLVQPRTIGIVAKFRY